MYTQELTDRRICQIYEYCPYRCVLTIALSSGFVYRLPVAQTTHIYYVQPIES